MTVSSNDGDDSSCRDATELKVRGRRPPLLGLLKFFGNNLTVAFIVVRLAAVCNIIM
jgi:hypothetical protein